jgi:hypothetical protein
MDKKDDSKLKEQIFLQKNEQVDLLCKMFHKVINASKVIKIYGSVQSNMKSIVHFDSKFIQLT